MKPTRATLRHVSESHACNFGCMVEYKPRGTGGRKSRGERRALITRVPVSLAAEIQTRADTAGVSITDYLAHVLAEHVAHEDSPNGAQQRLFADTEELAMTS